MNEAPEIPQGLAPPEAATVARLRAEVNTLRELLAVNESTAIEQTRRAEAARREEQRAAAASDTQRRLVGDLIESSRDSVIVLDAGYTILFLNGRAQALSAEGDVSIGRPVLQVFPALEGSSFWPRYQRVMETRTPISFEDFFPPAGAWFSVTVTPVGTGIAIFYRDITARRDHDQALARTEKLAAVGRMASSISHEINNPLEAVTNLLYLIEHTEATGDDMRTYAQLASSELARVSHIVTQTLKFHRQSTQATETSASEIIESVLSLYQSRIVTLRTTLDRRFRLPDAFTCFAGDMRQVLANFIGNALDATPTGGTLWLRTRPAHDPHTGVPGIRVTIADNGIGMDAATREKIFDAFFTTKGMTGSGLGLWVSDEIIRSHRGTVRLRSSTGPIHTGTVFSLFFPL